MNFATEVADIQESIQTELNKLIDAIAKKSRFVVEAPTRYMQIALIPPVVLILQLIEMTAGSASNITNIFENLQVPFDPFEFLRQYIPFVDWDDFEEKAMNYKFEKQIEQDIANKIAQNQQMGLG